MNHHFKILLLSSCFALFTHVALAQQTIIAFERNDEIPTNSLNGNPLSMGFSGGFNYITAGEIDLDLDGTKDLVLFDRSGDRITPLIWEGSPGNPLWRFDHSYVNQLPFAKNFMIFRDFNCDGKEDIFSFKDGGFIVYKNISSSSTGLRFEVYTESLTSYYNPANLPVYTIPIDVPAIEDMDNDGDLDVLVFGILGTCIEYHRNMAFEQLGRCDTLMLRLETDNWGKFTESLSTNQVILNDSCDIFGGKLSAENRHAGSSMLVLDLDGDSDKDMVLGDIAYRTVVMLTNGGSTTNALVTDQLSPWPPNTPFINLSVFPALSYVDIDKDGNRDLLASPNSEGGSENLRVIWYYHNTGTDDLPVFEFVSNDYFANQSFDFGEGSMPAFVDYNQDGLQDIVVGNYGYYQPSGTYRAQLALLLNTGTFSNPEYTVSETDLAGLGSLGGSALNFFPCFGDVDGDGDDDMLVGTSDGRIFYYMNTALAGQQANFSFISASFENIDIGTFAAPQLVDVDNDGVLDLLVGSREGRIHYYHNDGTVQSIQLSLVTETWGNISTSYPGEPSGFSTPAFFRKSGVSYMLCGSQRGPFYLYSGIDGNLEGDFILEDSLFLGDRDGERTTIALKDLNGDGFPEAVVGNYAGGLNFYQGIFPSSVKENGMTESPFRIFPNPGKQISIASPNSHITSIRVIDIQGRVCSQISPNTASSLITLDGSSLSNGLYFIEIQAANQHHVMKWINR